MGEISDLNTLPAFTDGVLLLVRDVGAATDKDKKAPWSLVKSTLQGVIVGARLTNTVTISIPNVTETTVTFDQERFDTNALHSTSINTGRLTAPVAGKYLIFANVVFLANATGERVALVRLNGGTANIAYGNNMPGSGFASINLATVYSLAAGDYVELRVFQSSGGALTIGKQSEYSPEFGMVLLSS